MNDNTVSYYAAGPAGLAARVITLWALAGGFVLLAVVLMSAYSISASAVAGAPFAGDFELVQMGVAVAAFCFLPYCQLTGANVTADIFTAGAPARVQAVLGLIASAVALGFAILILVQMWKGMFDYRKYAETTAILQIPHWMAFIPILISLALLALASALTLIAAWRDAGAR